MFRGIYTAPPTAGEGIQFMYVPDQQVIRVEGWQNQGRLKAVDMPLSDFLRGLGISLADCETALGGQNAQVVGQTATAQPTLRAASDANARQDAVQSQVPPANRTDVRTNP